MEIKFTKYDELKLLSELKPSKWQRNKHPKEQIKRLAKMMKTVGVRHPIHISKLSGEVCFGHGRWEAALLNGWDKFPVVYQDFKDEQEEFLCVQNDNSISQWAELDTEKLLDDLKNFPGIDIEQLAMEGIDCLDDFNVSPPDVLNPEIEFSKELNEKNDYLVLFFDDKETFKIACQKFGIDNVYCDLSRNGAEGFTMTGIGRILDGKKAIEKI